jgi:hypothetical protein
MCLSLLQLLLSWQEYNREEFKTREWIQRCIDEGIDLFNRTGSENTPSDSGFTSVDSYFAECCNGTELTHFSYTAAA